VSILTFYTLSFTVCLIFKKYHHHNQAFYSQANWGRLEMKSHEPKKTRAKKKEKTKGDKKTKSKKGEKTIKR
jgi:hypothetical protein